MLLGDVRHRGGVRGHAVPQGGVRCGGRPAPVSTGPPQSASGARGSASVGSGCAWRGAGRRSTRAAGGADAM